MQQPWGGAESILLTSVSLLSPRSSCIWRAEARMTHRYLQSIGGKIWCGTAWIWVGAFWHTPITAFLWFSGFFCAASKMREVTCVERAHCLSLQLVAYSEWDRVAHLLQWDLFQEVMQSIFLVELAYRNLISAGKTWLLELAFSLNPTTARGHPCIVLQFCWLHSQTTSKVSNEMSANTKGKQNPFWLYFTWKMAIK